MNGRFRPAFLPALVAVLAAALVLGGCGRSSDSLADGKVNVVTTFYPLYFLASEIGGEDAHVVNLVPAGVEPHDWTPKSQDLQLASKARLFVYNGAGLEGWTDDFLSGAGSGSQLLKVEASRGIALIEGAPEDEHDHASEEGEQAHDGHALDVDPHTWVSPKSALLMAGNIRDAYLQADPAHKDAYESRYNALKDKLNALDAEFAAGLAPYQGRDIVVSHQAFAYLCRDYGLHQTAIMGLSPEAEPRAQDMVNIIQFIKDKGIKAVFFEELVSNNLAETIAKETNAETLVLNPLEGLTPEQEKAGEDYFSLMRRNLQNLQKALQ
ncbi:ABC transporter substrate-binding protein [Cohnella sp. CFH 77786]|nr:ABC transporter substrate-binding protein [Cohnella sp. CFH 77786]